MQEIVQIFLKKKENEIFIKQKIKKEKMNIFFLKRQIKQNLITHQIKNKERIKKALNYKKDFFQKNNEIIKENQKKERTVYIDSIGKTIDDYNDIAILYNKNQINEDFVCLTKNKTKDIYIKKIKNQDIRNMLKYILKKTNEKDCSGRLEKLLYIFASYKNKKNILITNLLLYIYDNFEHNKILIINNNFFYEQF